MMKTKFLNIGIFMVALFLGVNTYAQVRGKRQGMSTEKLIEQLDTDKDGKLTKEEAAKAKRGKLTEDFEAIDANSDSFVNAEELENYMAEARKKRKQ